MNELSTAKKVVWLIFWASVVKILSLLDIGLIPDEAYYGLWAQKLDWSFYDHPPMLAWLLALGRLFISDPTLSIRITMIVIAIGITVYAWLLGRDIFNRNTGWRFVSMLTFTPLFFSGSLLATPDPPMIFFLVAALWHLRRAVSDGKGWHWLPAGFFMGCAMLSKYIAVLAFPAILVYLLLPGNRPVMRTWKPYAAFVLAMATFSPVVFWNAQYNWVSFLFQFHHGIGGKFPNVQKFLEFLGGQALLVGPFLFVLMIYTVRQLFAKGTKRTTDDWLLFLLFVMFFCFFLISSLQKAVEPNWPAFAWLPGLLLIARLVGKSKKTWVRAFWKTQWIYQCLIILTLLIHLRFPIVFIKEEITHQFFGWEQAATLAEEYIGQNPDYIPIANRYQVAAELSYYGDSRVYYMTGLNRPSQFDIWQRALEFQRQNLLVFDHRKELRPGFLRLFDHVEKIGEIPLERSGKKIGQLSVYRAINFHPPETP